MARSKYDDGGFSGGNTDRPALQRLLEDVRAGKIDIIEQTDANTYKALTKINTADGARSGLFVPERDALFVAIPHRGSQRAEIRRYQIE
jgi:hypothetical protein